MNKLITGLFVFFGPMILFAQKTIPIYKDKNVPIEKRIDDLLKRMTLEEKMLQTNQWTYGKNANENNIESIQKGVRAEIGSLIYRSINPVYRNQIMRKAMEESRLGIPILMGFDVIHGYRTVYPIPLAQACSWNTDLVTKACAVAAKESRLSGVDWTFSPMVDVARDPRWGRVAEGYGEDSYANAVFCVASVKGYQGKKLSDPFSIAACLKHYVGYSLSEGGRDYHSSDVSPQTLWETFMPPFQAGVKAGAATLMSGFNDMSGVPASANHYTLTEVLKERWKHDGFVVSDWGSVENLIAQGLAKDRKEAGLKSFLAGVEMDMVDNVYVDFLPQLVKEKKIPVEKIDDAVRRILRLKFKLGLFDNPYVQELPEKERYYQPESMAVAQQLAEESMVLLKNNNQVLPLSNDIRQIALIGPMVKDSVNMMGSWEGQGIASVVETIMEGFEKEFSGKTTLNYAKGCGFEGTDESGFGEAVQTAQKSDVVIVCLGEMKKWSGENASRSTIGLPAIQHRLLAELKKTGKKIILVLSNGRPIELGDMESLSDAIVEIWQPGIAGGTPLAGIISGRLNPSGKLAITFPLVTGQIPIYYNMRQSARPKIGGYQDISNEPKYWFGHGLSYTSFSYGNVKLSSDKLSKKSKLIAQVEVTNTGNRTGKETVFWYVSDPVASISRPMKELKYFEKSELKAGEKKVFKFEIDPERDLSFPDSNGMKRLENGDFYLTINHQRVKFELIN
ncbi:glycoside hydrolase family 3 N-terminal domain-containing protein [Flavobacterium sp. A45]|uniref:glycoside hydrolase family 3 N-terminal domain-containing protein n=1 Tax=Flavobacterium sp. A45 TaxID=1945862 RepID=UPI000985554C|nr:glycoside hydrolase family 3 N-terminal domain-containing protein [Flavobacterium sp. A45]OOG72645.1 beta-glucosidase [Flavobacterium sp. A45]